MGPAKRRPTIIKCKMVGLRSRCSLVPPYQPMIYVIYRLRPISGVHLMQIPTLKMKIAVTVQRGLNDDGDSWKPLGNG